MKAIKTAISAAAALAFLAGATVPAHAISESYRRQLEHDHKTQVQDAYGQHGAAAPATHFKPIEIKKYGVDFKRSADGFAYMDGKACAPDEVNAEAAAYSCGINQVIVRASGRVDLMRNGQFVGHMR